MFRSRVLKRKIKRFFSSSVNVFLTFLLVIFIFNNIQWLIGDMPSIFRGNGNVVNKDNAADSGTIAYYDRALQALSPIDVEQDTFLRSYRRKCEFVEEGQEALLPLCTCVPPVLYGKLPVPLESPSWSQVLNSQSDLSPGGQWKPRDCLARQRVSIILPYREREDHLRLLLYHVINIFKRHLLHFRIFLAEQVAGGLFNKALMMNAAFIEARQLWKFDCVIFHDIDMLLEDDRAIYACADSPRHLGAYVDKFRYRLTYPELFGGAVALKAEQFEAVNGYSNTYFGWGGEDDDLYYRLHAKGMMVERYPSDIARFQMVPHATDRGNPVNAKRMRSVDDITSKSMSDGLNTVSYIVVNRTNTPLHTHLLMRPSCWMHEKPFMGSSPALAIDTLVVDLETCRHHCVTRTLCAAISWDMHTNMCQLHGKRRTPTPKSNSLYYEKDCSKINL